MNRRKTKNKEQENEKEKDKENLRMYPHAAKLDPIHKGERQEATREQRQHQFRAGNRINGHSGTASNPNIVISFSDTMAEFPKFIWERTTSQKQNTRRS